MQIQHMGHGEAQKEVTVVFCQTPEICGSTMFVCKSLVFHSFDAIHHPKCLILNAIFPFRTYDLSILLLTYILYRKINNIDIDYIYTFHGLYHFCSNS